jgi:hypothetical protein
MSRFNSVLKKLDPDKQKVLIAWIDNIRSATTAENPIIENIVNNLSAEEHFDKTALENFLNELGAELIKSPNIDKSIFERLVRKYILKGDKITISIPSSKNYRLISLNGLSRIMGISSDDKDDIVDFITIAFENSDDEPIYGNIGQKEPVWSTFSWPDNERPYNGLTPRQILDKSGINWINEDEAMELVFERKIVEPIKYPTVADGGWNGFLEYRRKQILLAIPGI